jgi:hypothetical protein
MGTQLSRAFSVRLDDELLARIEELAAERRWSRNAWIAWACEQAVDADAERRGARRERKVEHTGAMARAKGQPDAVVLPEGQLAGPGPRKLRLNVLEMPGGHIAQAVDPVTGEVVHKASNAFRRDAVANLRAKLPADVELVER